MTALRLTNICKSFGNTSVLSNINLEVANEEFVVFVGPSGCGKSTLLRIIAGLENASSGTVEIAGKYVDRLPPAKRGIAMVFQSYALYPHLSVYDNMSMGLKQIRTKKKEIKERVHIVASMLALDELLDRRPQSLSGGQRQRVAIGRAIVRKPNLFLFDEPLSNLDATLRVNTRIEIAKLHRNLSTSMIYVTHDQIEAMTLADRIVVLRNGKIEQIGTPMDLYNDPDNMFVAGFLGAPGMNFIDAELLKIDNAKTVGIRPEHLTVGKKGKMRGIVTHIENLGGDTNIYLTVFESNLINVRMFGQYKVAIGQKLEINYDKKNMYLFDYEDKRIR